MPQSSYRKEYQSAPSDNTRIVKDKQLKTTLSREFSEFERYYDIENTSDHAFRKEHYIVDEFIYKSRNNSTLGSRKSSAQYGSRHNTASKPIANGINRFLPENKQSRKSIGPVKGIDTKLSDNVDRTKVPMDWNNYHRLAVIHKFMDNLESEFPSLCTTGVIGKSLENRDLKILKISNSDASNGRVWIDAGIHAREWIAPAVNTFVANYIARNFDSLPKSARNKDWYFMPVLNPDGYEYTHTTNRMWRKNKALVRHSLFGVDLNRNFSVGWGGKGSSDEPNHSFYRGPKPFSEPETSAMRDIFLNSGVSFQVYITLHSFGQVIIMPFAYKDELAPDYIRLLEGATVMSKSVEERLMIPPSALLRPSPNGSGLNSTTTAIYDTNGNTYKVGVSKDVMYQASGTSNDWSHGEVGIPFCYLIELRSKKHKFKVPKEEIAETGEEILNCVIALMEFIDNYKPPKLDKKKSQAPKSEESDTSSNRSREIETKNEYKKKNNSGVFSPTKKLPKNVISSSQTDKSYVSHMCKESEVQVNAHSDVAVPSSHTIEVQVSSQSNVSLVYLDS